MAQFTALVCANCVLQMKAMQGVKMSYRLHELLQHGNTTSPLRGVRVDDVPTSLNSYLYSLIRSNRSQRRGLLTSLLNMFDDTAVSLVVHLSSYLLFPYFSACGKTGVQLFYLLNIQIFVIDYCALVLQMFLTLLASSFRYVTVFV